MIAALASWLMFTSSLAPVRAAGHEFAVASAGQVVMGTVLEVQVVASTAEEARTLASQAITVARHWDEVLSPFLRHSELQLLQLQEGRAVYVSDDLKLALQRALELAQATGGAFEPAYRSALTGEWEHAKDMPLMSKVVQWKGAGVLLRPGGSIDPGAFGKGLALDAMVSWTQIHGAKEVFINFGGSSFARAARKELVSPSRRILVSRHDGTSIGVVELESGSLSVSESGVRDEALPISDPRSGGPVKVRRTAAVWATDGTSADAWSTALVVLGRNGLALAQQNGVEAAVIDDRGIAYTKAFPWHALSKPNKPPETLSSSSGEHTL